MTIDTTCGRVDTCDSTTQETTTRLVSGAEWQTWLAGSPFACAEHVWDEHDQETLRDVDRIEWVELPTPHD